MRRLIHRLRRHPEHVRRKILYVATIVSFFLLLGAWSISAGYRATHTDEGSKTTIKEDLKPFAMLKASLIDSTKQLSWPFGKTTVKNDTETTLTTEMTDTGSDTETIDTTGMTELTPSAEQDTDE